MLQNERASMRFGYRPRDRQAQPVHQEERFTSRLLCAIMIALSTCVIEFINAHSRARARVRDRAPASPGMDRASITIDVLDAIAGHLAQLPVRTSYGLRRGCLRRRVQIGDVTIDLSPNNRMEAFVALARFL